MFQENAVFEEILFIGLLGILALVCAFFPGVIADREEHENRSEKVKNKEVI